MDKKKKDIQPEDIDTVLDDGNQPSDEKQQIQDELIAQRDEWHNKYLRALADYQNLEARMNAQRMQIRQAEGARVLVSLLPFLDNLEAAEAFVTDPGLLMIKNQFAKQLEEMGLEELEVLGAEYDPHTAEAIEVVASDKDDDVVVEVLRRGYRYGDTVVRPAQVKVGKKMH